jgi:hypothetical protein
MNESGMLMKRKRQPFERFTRAVAEQRVGEVLARRELGRRDVLELVENPAMMRALALAVLVRESGFQPVLPGAGAAAEDLRDRKKVERALLRLRCKLIEPLGSGLGGTYAGRKGENRDEYPGFFS